MYELLILVGVIGYAAMVVMGFQVHHGGGAHVGRGGQFGHGSGHTAGHGHSVGHGHGHASAAKGGGSHTGGVAQALLRLIPMSPIDIFSLCIGAGLTGYVLTPLWKTAWLPLVALGGGIGLTAVLVRPMTSLILRFASKPAEGLEGALATLATAEGGFDRTGKGVVQVEVDGQLCRLLAQLPTAERGKSIRTGDQLLILDIDAKRNRCTVSSELELHVSEQGGNP